ncbi:hypothetical protein [Streptomyces sp. NPDC058374]|uniref:hypothetical protein n=1 Tax=Streptomyces sp. NPDC058374 TaxID=3346466 RepID=UPI003655F2D2
MGNVLAWGKAWGEARDKVRRKDGTRLMSRVVVFTAWGSSRAQVLGTGLMTVDGGNGLLVVDDKGGVERETGDGEASISFRTEFATGWAEVQGGLPTGGGGGARTGGASGRSTAVAPATRIRRARQPIPHRLSATGGLCSGVPIGKGR